MIFVYKKEGSGKGKRQWRWSVPLAIIISALTIWLSFRGIKLNQLKQALRGVNFFWVLIAMGNSLFTVYALGWRWRQLLNQRASLSYGTLFRLNILAQYANILAPARMGELLRMYLTSKEAKAESGFILGTIAAEKILDVVVFVAGWFFLTSYFAWQRALSLPFSLIMGTFGLMVLLILFVLKPSFVLRTIDKLLFFLPEKWRKPIIDFIKSGLIAFAYFKNPARTSLVLLLTLFLLFSQALTNYLVFLAFDLKLSFVAAVLIILAIQLGSVPPSAPGKIGIFEYVVILALTLFSVPREQALSYALILHLVAYLPKIILGGLYTARLPLDSLIKKR
ncbi:MAG: flippase-like domain-containing protein [Candidatus Aminicenantes bacterium]|nr:flippase-like domain-containing protein [Candidatus Aminicenantes bacterium]